VYFYRPCRPRIEFGVTSWMFWVTGFRHSREDGSLAGFPLSRE